jgi:hypothetical protein
VLRYRIARWGAMAHWQEEHPRSLRTHIFLLILLGAGLLVVLALAPEPVLTLLESSRTLLASAYVMPDDGWAPLMVYLSPFGSRELEGQIVRF